MTWPCQAPEAPRTALNPLHPLRHLVLAYQRVSQMCVSCMHGCRDCPLISLPCGLSCSGLVVSATPLLAGASPLHRRSWVPIANTTSSHLPTFHPVHAELRDATLMQSRFQRPWLLPAAPPRTCCARCARCARLCCVGRAAHARCDGCAALAFATGSCDAQAHSTQHTARALCARLSQASPL